MLNRLLTTFAALFALAASSFSQTGAPVIAPQYSKEYVDAIQESVRRFNEHDFPGALAAIDKAEKIMPPSAITLNTRGAIAVEEKRYAEGLGYLQKALQLDPKFYPARFNLGEIPLMQGRYAEARAVFEKMRAEHPKDELLMFRVLLCHLLEKNDAGARKVLDEIPFPGDTPSYYFANAAWEFAHDNPSEAQKWVARGGWVFSPDRTVNFLNSIYEIGWMQRPAPEAPKPISKVKSDATSPAAADAAKADPAPPPLPTAQ